MAKIILNGEISANNNVISNVTDPVANQDAATKHYVDTQISSAGGEFIAQNNGTGTGTTTLENLTVSGNTSLGSVNVTTSITVPTPSSGTNAANKTYVDTQISSSMGNYLPLAGGTMTNKAKIQYANASSGFVGVTYDSTTDTLTIGTLA